MTEETLFRLCDTGGWVSMIPIHKDHPGGGLLLGHCVRSYNWRGELESQKDVYNTWVFYE